MGDRTEDQILDDLDKPEEKEEIGREEGEELEEEGEAEEEEKEESKEEEESEEKEEPEEESTEEEVKEDDLLEDFDEVKDKDLPEPVSLLLKQIKGEFPDVIKKFPQIKAALFKTREFESIFADAKEARAASERIGIYTQFDNEISRGNLKPLITVLKNSQPKALAKIVEDFSENLDDTKLSNMLAEPTIRSHMSAMLRDAQNSGNKNLELAARYTIQYLYGETGLPEKGKKLLSSKQEPEVSDELRELRQREFTRSKEAFDGIQSSIMNETEKKLLSYITKNIDPEKQMTEFTRSAAAEKAYSALLDKLSEDPAHNRRLAGLWNQIRRDHASAKELGPKLTRAFLGGAKPYLPALIARTRSKALGLAIKKADTGIVGGGTISKFIAGGKGGRLTDFSSLSGKKIDSSKTSEDDILEAAFSGDLKKIHTR